MPAAPPSPARAPLARIQAWSTSDRRIVDVVVLATLAVAVLAVYLPYALRGGWYLDDWDFYSGMQDAADHSYGGLITACRQEIAGGRTAACLYHAGIYGVLGDHRTLYHVVAMAFLWGMAALTYAILRITRVPRAWAGAASLVLVLYPASDATRLWAVAAVGQYVMVLYLAGLALGLRGLLAGSRPRAAAFHAASLALTVLAVATYEIVIPLVALNGLVYLAAAWKRQRSFRLALARGAVDLVLAAGFALTRVKSSSTADVFVIERTTSQSIDRARLLVRRSWDVWHDVFVPGIAGLVVFVAVVVAAVVVAFLVPTVRRRLLGWTALLVVALGFMAACAVAYVSANDFYVPDTFSTFNRTNLAGSIAASVAFVALAAMALEVGRGLRVPRLTAVVVAIAAVVVAVHMIGLSTTHKRSWEESWRAQKHAIQGYRVALRTVPRNAAIVGFDTPRWENGFVPVFGTTWDLRGAIDYTTAHDPPVANPAGEGMSCDPTGLSIDGHPFAEYRNTQVPLFFVSPNRGRAEPVRSQRACQRVYAQWGPPPFWGRTVSDPAAVERGAPIATGAASTTPR